MRSLWEVGFGVQRVWWVEAERAQADAATPGYKRHPAARPWQFVPANKKVSVLPTHPFPQTHYTPEQRQSAAASMGSMG